MKTRLFTLLAALMLLVCLVPGALAADGERAPFAAVRPGAEVDRAVIASTLEKLELTDVPCGTLQVTDIADALPQGAVTPAAEDKFAVIPDVNCMDQYGINGKSMFLSSEIFFPANARSETVYTFVYQGDADSISDTDLVAYYWGWVSGSGFRKVNNHWTPSGQKTGIYTVVTAVIRNGDVVKIVDDAITAYNVYITSKAVPVKEVVLVNWDDDTDVDTINVALQSGVDILTPIAPVFDPENCTVDREVSYYITNTYRDSYLTVSKLAGFLTLNLNHYGTWELHAGSWTGDWHTQTITVNCCVDANGHRFGTPTPYPGATGGPTCTESGKGTAYCSKCKTDCEIRLPSLGKSSHTMEWVVTQEPTCNLHGLKSYICKVCGWGDPTKDESIPSLDHKYEHKVVIAPTCTTAGYSVDVCTLCGWENFLTRKDLPATGHTMSARIVVEEPTCTEDGFSAHVCTSCGWVKESSIKVVPATGHKMQETSRIEPTCEEKGKSVSTCTVCGYTQTTKLPATGHRMERVNVVEPTCVDQGVSMYVCANCGWQKPGTEKPVPTTSHTWDKGVITVAPTEDTLGVKRFTCTVCGATDDRPCHLCPAEDYLDRVGDSHWAHEGIDFCMKHGIMESTSTSRLTFEPNSVLVRSQLAAILWKLEGSPVVEEVAPFTDVKPTAWYAPAANWAYANGIISGNGQADGTVTFDGKETVSREMFATMLYRYYTEYLDLTAEEGADLSSFPDADRVHKWAADAMAWANATGLITGSKENGSVYLNPRATATRAQTAVILMRLCGMLPE